MKKRILTLALSLVLLLSLVPFALAADTAERELWLHLDSRLLGYGYVMADDENEIYCACNALLQRRSRL